jgi:excisionase family DNA binding protein
MAYQLYDINQVSKMLTLSRSSIYREINNGNLKVVKIGKSIRFHDEEIERYINSLVSTGA